MNFHKSILFITINGGIRIAQCIQIITQVIQLIFSLNYSLVGKIKINIMENISYHYHHDHHHHQHQKIIIFSLYACFLCTIKWTFKLKTFSPSGFLRHKLKFNLYIFSLLDAHYIVVVIGEFLVMYFAVISLRNWFMIHNLCIFSNNGLFFLCAQQ